MVQFYTSKKLTLFFLIILCSFFATSQAQTTRYVTKNGAGTKDGLSWANASNDIQLMINNSEANDMVWVARGIYKPIRPADNLGNIKEENISNAFVLKKNVEVYGGFAGTETNLSDRKVKGFLNTTILSGKLNLYLNINARHVVISVGNVGTARLDGFTITGGIANNTDYIIVNSRVVTNSNGGGVYIAYSSPTITNCKINKNTAGGYGGGIYIEYDSKPYITNSIIINNNAYRAGGGIVNYSSSPTITNCTIAATISSIGIFNLYGSLKINNSIVWGGVGRYPDDNSEPEIKNSLGHGRGFYTSIDNDNINASGIKDTDIFNNPSNDNYTLKAGSVAVNKGNNALYTNASGSLTTDTDLAGNPRVYQSIIDIGAYELGSLTTLSVGEDAVQLKAVELYPNPAVNSIRLDIGMVDTAAIQIFDINGKLVIEKKNYQSKEIVNISSLKTGVYLIRVVSTKGNAIKKFIKN